MSSNYHRPYSPRGDLGNKSISVIQHGRYEHHLKNCTLMWITLLFCFLYYCKFNINLYSTAWKYWPICRVLTTGPPSVIDEVFPVQPRLYLGKTEDGIRLTAAAFWTRHYHGNKDASSLSRVLFPSCFFATKRAWMLNLESLHFHRKVAFDKADHRCWLQDWWHKENLVATLYELHQKF